MQARCGPGDIWQLAESSSNSYVVVPTNLVFVPSTNGKRLVMGAGLAKQASERYPNIQYDIVKEYEKHSYLGNFLWEKLVHVLPCGIIILPTKQHWKNASNLWLIVEGLKQLRKEMDSNPLLRESVILVPQIGCGLGGLNWYKTVRPEVVKYLVEGMEKSPVKTVALIESGRL